MATSSGEFSVTVVEREDLAQDVVQLTFAALDGAALPGWEPGAHIDLHLAGRDDERLGGNPIRQYSLCGCPSDRGRYRIAVLAERAGRGGSRWIHDQLRVGDVLMISAPRNHFALVDADDYLLVAGGIGITPLLPMIRNIAARGRSWRLVYGGRTRGSMAFVDELSAIDGAVVELNPQDEVGLLDLPRILDDARPGTSVYSCGPEPLLAALESACAGRPLTLHLERFAPKPLARGVVDTVFEVELARSGQVLEVGADTSLLDALEEAGLDIDFSCREGTCGTCETAVLKGTPDHRDSILTDEEKAANNIMFPCVSRSLSSRVVLNL